MFRDFRLNKPHTFRSRTLIAVATLICALGVTGCGQTGPLYLPDEKPGKQENNE